MSIEQHAGLILVYMQAQQIQTAHLVLQRRRILWVGPWLEATFQHGHFYRLMPELRLYDLLESKRTNE